MDDLEKKLFAQFDDDMPAVRSNALESLRERLKAAGRTFRDMIADFENAISPAKIEELEKQLEEYRKANAAAEKRDASQQREIAALKAAVWVKTNWRMVGAGAAALLGVVTGYWSYERYFSRSDAVMAGLRAAVASATWSEGWSEPMAARIGGEPYWLMFKGDIDASSYSDRYSRPVEMRCLHLFAAPARPDSGEYLIPSPRNFLGWVKWPELATHCERSPNQQADNFK